MNSAIWNNKWPHSLGCMFNSGFEKSVSLIKACFQIMIACDGKIFLLGWGGEYNGHDKLDL